MLACTLVTSDDVATVPVTICPALATGVLSDTATIFGAAGVDVGVAAGDAGAALAVAAGFGVAGAADGRAVTGAAEGNGGGGAIDWSGTGPPDMIPALRWLYHSSAATAQTMAAVRITATNTRDMLKAILATCGEPLLDGHQRSAGYAKRRRSAL